MVLWRISNQLSLDGKSGLVVSGRWHTRGRRVVYSAESPAAALLEVLVHFEIELRDLPARYRLLRLEAPDDIQVEEVPVGLLPADWALKAEVTRAIGEDWLARGERALLRAPSALVPDTFNVLVNPVHEHARHVDVVHASEHVIDPRLLK